ncbi:MAG: CoA transferase [Chloroflexi bacterium]|nr:CoA transferase [Chloroflexota bacterium]
MDPTNTSEPPGDVALSGIRVLDLADPTGLYCTKLLADLGAEVIRIEPPGGDATRKIGPFFHDDPNPEKSLFFFHFNTNKRSVTLDLTGAEGRQAFRKLAAGADILVETFQPGYLAGMGLGYEDLKALNPAMIVTSITGFGQTGPRAGYKSCDLVGMATGGLMSMCGWPDLPPLRLAGSQANYMASVQAAAGTLIALLHRLRTGQGQHVDVSMQQSVPVCMQTGMLIYDKTREIRKRSGAEATQPGQGIFPCKDGYVDIGQLSALLWWDRLANWLDSEGAAEDLKEEKWRDPFHRTRPEAIKHINEVIKSYLAKHTKEEIFHRGQSAGVVIGPVNTPEDIIKDENLQQRRFLVPVEHPELGVTLQYLGPPVRFSGTPWRISRRAPLLGEDNHEILGAAGSPARSAGAGQPAGPRPQPGKAGIPLEGLKVLEFTEQVAGPMAGKALADFGAQVILVENEQRARFGSSSRHPSTGAASLTSLNLGNHFNKFNTNKLSVTLDMTRPRGMEIARQLIGRSDVVISNFVPRVLQKWGFSYSELKKIKPDIIFVTMPAFGAEGRYRDYRTLSWNLMAQCGLDYASRFPGRPPIRASPWSHPDTCSQPFHALVGTLAALYWRAVTGKGQHVEICQYESTLCFSETFIFDYLVNGRLPAPMGNRLDWAAPHGVFRCQGDDRWCAIAVFTGEEWQGLCRAIGRPELARDERFASLGQRKAHSHELETIVNQWTAGRSPWEVMELMQAAGVPAGAVENEEDLLNDPQLKARNHWLRIPHPEAGALVNDDWAFKLSAVPAVPWRHAPLLGEHNDFVLHGILGIPEAEIDQLIMEGVIS